MCLFLPVYDSYYVRLVGKATQLMQNFADEIPMKVCPGRTEETGGYY
jgi:hypothetical protein